LFYATFLLINLLVCITPVTDISRQSVGLTQPCSKST